MLLLLLLLLSPGGLLQNLVFDAGKIHYENSTSQYVNIAFFGLSYYTPHGGPIPYTFSTVCYTFAELVTRCEGSHFGVAEVLLGLIFGFKINLLFFGASWGGCGAAPGVCTVAGRPGQYP